VAEREVEGFRVAPDRVGVLFELLAGDFEDDLAAGFAADLAEDARDEDDFVDFDFEAGVFCFVATGVRDSLVAPSARQKPWYRPTPPEGRMRVDEGGICSGRGRPHLGTTFSPIPKG